MITKRRKLKVPPTKRRRPIPYDDEPVTAEDIAAMREADRDRKAGRVYTTAAVWLQLAMSKNAALARDTTETEQ